MWIILVISAILIPPLICYCISKIENRNTRRWSLYGLFFGIFAVIYLVFYIKKDDDDKIAPRAMVLLGIFMVLMILSVFETIFGLF